MAQSVFSAFGDSIRVATEEHGLRLYEDRGLDGFVDGTENPQGDDNVRNVAIIPEGKPDAGGSYVCCKIPARFEKWDAVPTAEQEACVGRSKEANDEFSKDVRLPDSPSRPRQCQRKRHWPENCPPQPALRQTQWRTWFDVHILLQHAAHIEVQLLNMFGDADGKTDLLLKHLSKAVSGAYYYAPSVERFKTFNGSQAV